MTTPTLTVTATGIDVALRAIEAVQSPALPKAIGVAVAELAVIPAAQPYPGRSGRRMPIKSAAQRRLIFAKVRSGEIPYRRTYRLLQGWRFQGRDNGAVVENTAAHAELVVGEGQAAYHAGTWRTVLEIAKDVEHTTALRVGEAAAALFITRLGIG